MDFSGTNMEIGATNHISRSNNLVLAEKILCQIRTGSDIDLRTGFHSRFITKAALYDPVFRAKEMVDPI